MIYETLYLSAAQRAFYSLPILIGITAILTLPAYMLGRKSFADKEKIPIQKKRRDLTEEGIIGRNKEKYSA